MNSKLIWICSALFSFGMAMYLGFAAYWIEVFYLKLFFASLMVSFLSLGYVANTNALLCLIVERMGGKK